MNRVIHRLYIGCADDFNYPDKLLVEGISEVIKLYDSRPDYPTVQDYFTVHEHVANDGAGWTNAYLTEVIFEMNALIREGKSIIVCCAAGQSRSAIVVLAYLCFFHKMRPKEAWRLLKDARPQVDPNLDLLAFLLKFLGVHPYLSTLIGNT